MSCHCDRVAIGWAIAIGEGGGGETIEWGVGGGVLGQEVAGREKT